MKRFTFLILATLLCLPVAAYAASIGGADTQGQGKVSISLDQEIMFNRDMELSGTNFDIPPGLEIDPEIKGMSRTMVKTNYKVNDNLDIYLRLGIADLVNETSLSFLGVDVGKNELKTRNAFAYGFGLKGTRDLENNYLIGGDFQYLRHKNTFSAKYVEAGSPDEITDGKIAIEEWHIASYVGKRIENFVPYIGIRYSDLRAEIHDNEDDKIKLKAADNFGVFLGTDYTIDDNWSLNLEGRFIDETAMSFGGAYRF